MKTEAKIKKWGNSLAIRIPSSVVKKYELNEDDLLNIDNKKNGLFLTKSKPKQNIVDWFLNSPVKGDFELDITRDKSTYIRDIEL
jgi:hypothetical protein